jgi:two-component system, LytTR family, sensor histidine kinase AlgZ
MSARPPAPAAADDQRRLYLPDFCAAPAVLAVVLIATLLGFVLALARQSAGGSFWTDLARTSAFLLWTGLLCAAVLCKARPRLMQMELRNASLCALGLMTATVVLVAESVYLFGHAWEERIGTRSGLFPTDHWSFLLPKVCLTLIVGALALRYFYVASQWRRSVELEARARLHALQARIRPHFLFNSLNAIASLTRSDPGRAEEAIEDLADLFRASLSDARARISLSEELEVARTYQRIEQLRMGDRLQVRWDVADLPARAVVPGLLLQPLLENAVGHGIEPLPAGGTVTVRGAVDGHRLVIEVTNPVAPAGRTPRPGNRMALDNIRQRLELAFPGQSSVDVQEAGGLFRVQLRFPLVTAGTPAAADGP